MKPTTSLAPVVTTMKNGDLGVKDQRDSNHDTAEHDILDDSDGGSGSVFCFGSPDLALPEELEQFRANSKRFARRRIYGFNQTPLEFLLSFFPLFPMLRGYRWRWLANDFFSGIIVSMIHLPQAMAGAMTAVMKPQHGLFMTMIPALMYAIFGTSPQNSVGGMPITAALAGVSMARIREEYHPDNFTMSPNDMLELHFGIAGVVAFVAGIIQISMGIFKLGFLSKLVSSNVLDPFSVACCLQAICGQLPVMFGIKLYPYCGLYKHPWLVVNMMASLHTVNGADTVISAVAASVILVFREFGQPYLYRKIKLVVPIEFLVMIAGTWICFAFDLQTQYGVRVMGTIPDSLPYPKVPSMEYVPHVLLEGFISAVVSFTITLSSAKILARQNADVISPSQELIAVGSSNLFGSFFSCFVSAAPIGRSIINQSMGSKSQLSSLFGCLFMVTLFLTCGQALKYLPVCIISTNIVVTLIMTLKIFADLPNLWRASKLDAMIWISTFLSCIFLDVRIGLITGVMLSLFSIIYRSQRPKIRVLGRIKDSQGYVPLKYYKEAAEVAGIKILQIQSALHYGNAEYLVKHAKYLTFLRNTAPTFQLDSVLAIPPTQNSDQQGSSRRRSSLPVKLYKAAPPHRPLTFKPNDLTTVKVQQSLRRIEESNSDLYADMEMPKLDGAGKFGDTTVQITTPTESVVYGVVLDLSMTTFIDSVGLRALEQLADDLDKVHVGLFLVQNKGSIIQHIKKREILKVISEKSIFLCLEDAVFEAVRRGTHVLTPSGRPRRLSQDTDSRYWPTDMVRVEGLPATNQRTSVHSMGGQFQ
ncbi:Prestin [Hypsibius exemplaris]|uniref:Prestin n=1 Tax=Hypsibius exemplaris TaxID=2072580 RepID=A0A1W0WND7_HYPEX|nr:Prestin [Hypsibius exemplaris]